MHRVRKPATTLVLQSVSKSVTPWHRLQQNVKSNHKNTFYLIFVSFCFFLQSTYPRTAHSDYVQRGSESQKQTDRKTQKWTESTYILIGDDRARIAFIDRFCGESALCGDRWPRGDNTFRGDVACVMLRSARPFKRSLFLLLLLRICPLMTCVINEAHSCFSEPDCTANL